MSSSREKKKAPRVSNVKLSCSIDLLDGSAITLNKDVDKKRFSNFTVVRKKYVYIIFKRRKISEGYHVNITKVPSTAQIQASIDELSNIITNKFVVKSYKIENLTCSFDVGFNIPLMDVFDRVEKKSYVKKARFNPERFPGMFVTFESSTVLLFSSGKMVIIGANTFDSVDHSLKLIMSCLNEYKPVQI